MPYLLLLFLSLSACSSGTKIVSDWSAPEKAAPAHKILLIGLMKDPVTRRFFEAHFAEQAKKEGFEIMPSYLWVPQPTDLDEKQEVVELVQKIQAEGVLIAVLKGVEKEYGHVPDRFDWHPDGYAFDPFYDYFYQTYRAVYRSGYVGSDNFFNVQLHYFDVASQKKLWAAQIVTKNPRSLVETVYHIAAESLDALKSKGLIQ